VLELPGIAVDVDNPSDLQRLISLPGETRAQRLGREYARAGTGRMSTSASPAQPRGSNSLH
jgi:2-phospho-L-lactate guanylyltransferase (CobY/MobA/RfbA family)